MPESIKESDWKRYGVVKNIALARHCKQTLDRLREITSVDDDEFHPRYLEAYSYIRQRDKEVAEAFNDYRRSTAETQLIFMQNYGLLTDEDLVGFSDDILDTLAHVRKFQSERKTQ